MIASGGMADDSARDAAFEAGARRGLAGRGGRDRSAVAALEAPTRAARLDACALLGDLAGRALGAEWDVAERAAFALLEAARVADTAADRRGVIAAMGRGFRNLWLLPFVHRRLSRPRPDDRGGGAPCRGRARLPGARGGGRRVRRFRPRRRRRAGDPAPRRDRRARPHGRGERGRSAGRARARASPTRRGGAGRARPRSARRPRAPPCSRSSTRRSSPRSRSRPCATSPSSARSRSCRCCAGSPAATPPRSASPRASRRARSRPSAIAIAGERFLIALSEPDRAVRAAARPPAPHDPGRERARAGRDPARRGRRRRGPDPRRAPRAGDHALPARGRGARRAARRDPRARDRRDRGRPGVGARGAREARPRSGRRRGDPRRGGPGDRRVRDHDRAASTAWPGSRPRRRPRSAARSCGRSSSRAVPATAPTPRRSRGSSSRCSPTPIPMVRRRAAYVAGNLGLDRLAPALAKLCGAGEPPDLRLAGYVALGELGMPGVITEVVAAVRREEDPRVLGAASNALIASGPEPARSRSSRAAPRSCSRHPTRACARPAPRSPGCSDGAVPSTSLVPLAGDDAARGPRRRGVGARQARGSREREGAARPRFATTTPTVHERAADRAAPARHARRARPGDRVRRRRRRSDDARRARGRDPHPAGARRTARPRRRRRAREGRRRRPRVRAAAPAQARPRTSRLRAAAGDRRRRRDRRGVPELRPDGQAARGSTRW